MKENNSVRDKWRNSSRRNTENAAMDNTVQHRKAPPPTSIHQASSIDQSANLQKPNDNKAIEKWNGKKLLLWIRSFFDVIFVVVVAWFDCWCGGICFVVRRVFVQSMQKICQMETDAVVTCSEWHHSLETTWICGWQQKMNVDFETRLFKLLTWKRPK